MRILLIIPTFGYKSEYPSFLSVSDFPVGFAYLASALRSAGFQVFGLNLNNQIGFGSARHMLRDKISQALRDIEPDLACIGGLCTDYSFLKEAICLIREMANDIPIVLGGGIISNDPEFIFKTLRPDFCIVGEGEEILVQLATCLKYGQKSYDHISNLGYWENEHMRFTDQNFNYPDLNQRAFPDYEPFGIKEMLDNYSFAARYLYRYTRLNPRPMPIVAARSCPFKCTFCVHKKGPKYRSREIDNIMREVGILYENYEFNVLIILDELFAVNKLRLRNFSEAILHAKNNMQWDFDWIFQTHASASFDKDTLRIAKEAGCYFFSYGLESASPKVLQSMHKKTKPSKIIDTIKIADENQIGFGGNFIFGDVAETKETLDETMTFFDKYCNDIHIYLGLISPYPGSRLFDYCLEQGVIKDKIEYYEHIGEMNFNMTHMSSLFWYIWSNGLGKLSRLFLWNKSVPAISCRPVNEMADNPMVLFLGQKIYEIGAVCPFCKKEFVYRSFLPKQRLKRTNERISFMLRVKQSKWFFELFYLTISLLSFWRPIKLLLYLKGERGKGDSDIMTGCPFCNKRMRISWEN
jgi:radical SAM superfamily enzyme YgiQ (UPF0313 family)